MNIPVRRSNEPPRTKKSFHIDSILYQAWNFAKILKVILFQPIIQAINPNITEIKPAFTDTPSLEPAGSSEFEFVNP